MYLSETSYQQDAMGKKSFYQLDEVAAGNRFPPGYAQGVNLNFNYTADIVDSYIEPRISASVGQISSDMPLLDPEIDPPLKSEGWVPPNTNWLKFTDGTQEFDPYFETNFFGNGEIESVTTNFSQTVHYNLDLTGALALGVSNPQKLIQGDLSRSEGHTHKILGNGITSCIRFEDYWCHQGSFPEHTIRSKEVRYRSGSIVCPQYFEEPPKYELSGHFPADSHGQYPPAPVATQNSLRSNHDLIGS